MFEKIEYVYEVYKEKGFSKAAKKLYVSQPYLSSVIKKLEDRIGAPIFERRYSELRPTAIGREYIEAIEQIMEIKSSFASKLGQVSRIEYGEIRVGGSNYICSYVLPELIKRFSNHYPKIKITVVENNSCQLEKLLDNEEIDLLIDSFDNEDSKFDYNMLTKETILLAVPKSRDCNDILHKYAVLPRDIFNGKADAEAMTDIGIENFKNENFILLKKGNNMSRHSKVVFEKASFRPEISFELDQLTTAFAIAAGDNGLCFVTDTIFKYHNYGDNMLLYKVKNSGSRNLYIAHKKTRRISEAEKRFVKKCIDTCHMKW